MGKLPDLLITHLLRAITEQSLLKLMKLTTTCYVFTACALHTQLACAATSLSMDFGSLKNSTGAKLADDTLVVLIANSDITVAALPGGLTDHLTSGGLDATLAQNQFAGKTLAVGNTINLDKIIYVGSINGLAGYGAGYEGIAFDSNAPIDYTGGVATGQSFGLYWFPGLTIANNTVDPEAFEIGGFFNSDPNLGDIGMTLPGDGLFSVIQRDSDAAVLDGFESSILPSAFNAIAVPEPATLTLTALAALGLLRRRRA